jgi:hypothetical protein
MWINASRHPMESQNWSPLAYHHSICVVPSPNPTNAKACAKGFGLGDFFFFFLFFLMTLKPNHVTRIRLGLVK